MRRFLDITISLVVLLLLLPVILVVVLTILFTSGTPVIFRQTRVGRDGKPFAILKFRTMTFGSSGPVITSAADPRITRFGRILRQTKLDELPQLLNVLSGDMSLVGPRPDLPSEVAQLDPVLRSRLLSVRPGMTDDASIHFRDEESQLLEASDVEGYYREVIQPIKLQLSLGTVQHMSLQSYIRTLYATARVVLFKRRRCTCDQCNGN